MGPEAAVTLIVAGVGVAVAWSSMAQRTDDRYAAWLQALAWGPGLGLGLVSLTTFWALFLGFGQSLFVILVLALVGSAAWALWTVRALPARPHAASRPVANGCPDWMLHVTRGMLVLTSLGLAWACATWVLNRPYGTMDAVNIWGARALFLHRGGDGLQAAFALMEMGHPDYPLMLPAAHAGQFRLAASESLAIPQATAALFLFALACLVHATLRRWTSRFLATAATVFVLSTPMLWSWSFSQGADLPMAYWVLAVLVGLAALLADDRTPWISPWLVGFSAGMLSWTKNEGMVLAAGFLLLFVVARIVARTRAATTLRYAAILGISALPGLLSTYLFKSQWVAHDEAARFLADALAKLLDSERWLQSVGGFFVQQDPWTHGRQWGAVWVVLGVMLLATVAGRRRWLLGAPLFLLTGLAGAVCVYMLAYVLSPYELAWHTSKSADRLLLQLFPALVVAVFAVFAGRPPAAEESPPH